MHLSQFPFLDWKNDKCAFSCDIFQDATYLIAKFKFSTRNLATKYVKRVVEPFPIRIQSLRHLFGYFYSLPTDWITHIQYYEEY